MLEGGTRHGVDLQQYDVQNNELLFILPHQIHQLPLTKHGTDYFKLAFDENCLSLLPKQYPFLINSIKELAYDLGVNDPEYFSRLFKKVTGKTISMFVQDLSGN